LLDGNTIMSYGLEFAPALVAILAAAFGVWIVWRLVRGALNALFRKREERPEPVAYSIIQERREPVLGPPAAPSSSSSPSIPDAADVLALKASIDALTRQIASLEKRLVPALDSLSTTVAAPAAGDDSPRASVKLPLAS
jgi:hypothetical protein